MKKLIRKIVGDEVLGKIHDSRQKRVIKEQERKETLVRKNFYSQFINKGDFCFDVGANLGNRISPLLEIGAKVIAIEPQEECCKILREKFGNKIELIPLGVGEKEDIKKFYISNASTISSFAEDWINTVKQDRFKEYQWNDPIEIKITTLDKIIEEYGKPTFIKIDVEGYETEVLKGLSSSIKYISFEYTVPEFPDKVIKCMTILYEINNKVEFNYSIGESMNWASNDWYSFEQMLELVRSNEFTSTLFGDIYARNTK